MDPRPISLSAPIPEIFTAASDLVEIGHDLSLVGERVTSCSAERGAGHPFLGVGGNLGVGSTLKEGGGSPLTLYS